MTLGDPEPSFTSRCWQTDEEDSDRQFAIVADLSRADTRTLNVYHEPDRSASRLPSPTSALGSDKSLS